MEVVALDFETYYDDECTVSDLDNWAYTHHPNFHPLLIAASDGEETWAGPVEDFEWESLRGKLLLAHNAGFDRAVLGWLIEQGRAPSWLQNAPWRCTAALSSYVGGVRSLRDAMFALEQKAVSKDTRNRLKGVTLAKLRGSPLWQEACDYAARDVEFCFHLWRKYHGRWPEHEQRLWEMTLRQCARGVAVDTDKLRIYRERLADALCALEKSLPWVAEGAPPTSPRALAQACRDAGIPVPPLKTYDEDGYNRWEATYGPRFPWVGGVAKWRQLTKLSALLDTIHGRLRPDNTIEFSLLYFGAHTGRWSGGGSKLNMQNLRKTPLYLVGDEMWVGDGPPPAGAFALDVRSLFVPRPGKQMLVADLSQIEPRVLAWCGGNTELLDLLKSGMSIYEAFARVALGWRGGNLKAENPDLYQLAKIQVLGLGYGCGPKKFVDIAAGYGVALTGEQSAELVQRFRQSNPHIVGLWQRLEQGLFASVGDDFVVTLPSGRCLTYREVRRESALKRDPVTGTACPRAVTTARIGLQRYEFYGGVLTENLVQATARDVFAEHLLALDGTLGDVLWHVHDEVILETDPDITPEDVVHAMSRTPDWLEGCPVTAEAEVVPHYKK